MQAPIVKLARTLNEVPGKFVRTLAAVRDAKEKPQALNPVTKNFSTRSITMERAQILEASRN